MIPHPRARSGLRRRRLPRPGRLLGALAAAVALAPGLASAAPTAELWTRWTKNDPRSTETVDHSRFSAFLATYVRPGADGINRVAYAEVSAQDRAALKSYLRHLSGTRVTGLSRAEQLPFWINLYNALTLDVVLDHYPVDSIRDIDISPGFFSDGPWGKKLLRVEGVEISLDDVEHRILRPIWRDPRIHYAVNCASLGCPNLRRQAFTAANTEAMLDQAARDYVNHPRGARVEDGRLHVSSIYHWFEADFGGDDAGVIAHLKRYAEPPLLGQLDGITSIASHSYDWRLNDAK